MSGTRPIAGVEGEERCRPTKSTAKLVWIARLVIKGEMELNTFQPPLSTGFSPNSYYSVVSDASAEY